MVHNPAYDFNDHNIGIGAAYWVALTQDFLSPHSCAPTLTHHHPPGD
jgi:hypothetical protein